MVEDKRFYISTLESRSYGHPDNSTGVVEEEEEAQITVSSPEENLEERGVTEAGLAQVMGGQEDNPMEEETYELWGERDVLTEQYFPSKTQVEVEDDMLMLAAEEEEINQMLASIPLEHTVEDEPLSSK